MADLTAAKLKVVSTLRDAGMIHPHTGHEKVVSDALDVFASSVVEDLSIAFLRELTDKPAPSEETHADEIADAENNHGQDEFVQGDPDAEVIGVGAGPLRTASGLPTAEDLDAVAAEEAAREATRGPVAVTEDAPVEIEHERYAVDDAVEAEPETEAAAAETEEPVSEAEQTESEQEQPVVEPVSQVEEVADGD